MRRFFVAAALVTLLALLAACTDDAPDRSVPPTSEPAAGAADGADGTLAPVPEARTEVGAARFESGDILVVGGLRADGSTTARADRFVAATGAWVEAPRLPVPLHHPGVASFGGRVVVAGGYAPDSVGGWVESERVWSLGPGDDEWRAEPALPTPRGALGLVGTPTHLVAFGGTSGGGVVDRVDLLAAGARSWTAGPKLRQPREHTAGAFRDDDGRVFAIGGRVGPLETNLATVESLDPVAPGAGWRTEPPLLASRGGIAAATVGDAVCVAGGEEPGGTIAGVECLVDGGWRRVADLAVPRHGLGVVAGSGRRLHVLAGGPEPGLFVSGAHEVVVVP